MPNYSRSRRITKRGKGQRTSGGTNEGAGALLLVAVICYFVFFRKKSEPLPIPPDFRTQIAILQKAEQELTALRGFIDQQSSTLAQRESLVIQLQARIDSLRPVAESNRKTVDAILSASAASQERGKWRERLYGFLFGVPASMLASMLVGWWQRFRRRGAGAPAA